MIDSLLRFDDDAAAAAAREALNLHDGNSHLCRVYVVTGTTTDPESGAEVDVREYQPEVYVWASGDFSSHPDCRVVADRDKAAAGQPFILFTALPVEQLAAFHIDPVVAGSNYPFGV